MPWRRRLSLLGRSASHGFLVGRPSESPPVRRLPSVAPSQEAHRSHGLTQMTSQSQRRGSKAQGHRNRESAKGNRKGIRLRGEALSKGWRPKCGRDARTTLTLSAPENAGKVWCARPARMRNDRLFGPGGVPAGETPAPHRGPLRVTGGVLESCDGSSVSIREIRVPFAMVR